MPGIAVADVTVRDEGTIVGFTAHTPEVKEWMEASLDAPAWAWLGDTLGVYPRLAEGLIDLLEEQGFSVEKA